MMNNTKIVLIVALGGIFLSGGHAFGQTTYRVDVNATTPPHDGSSWCNGFLDLQSAIAVAGATDTILVANGTYYPDDGEGLTRGEQTLSFDILNDMELKGGYEGISGLPGGTENDRTESVGNDRSLTVGHDKTEDVGNDKSVNVGNDQQTDWKIT